MEAGIWHTRTSLFPVVGLLVLVGVFSNVHVAWAQSQGECALPAGATPPPNPRVTAQQVEDGTATRKDFAVAVRDQFKVLEGNTEAANLGNISYTGCLVRQEGSAYRSGSTYLVSLTPDFRVLVHAKDMSLSGRLLKAPIVLAILSSLGVERSVLEGLYSPDQETAIAASFAYIQTLLQEPDGQFDAATPVFPDLQGIPGASGHAAVYLSGFLQSPLMLLAGFDLNESHLETEEIDYGNPTVTAKDVVDRETLKAFVAEAVKFTTDTIDTGLLTGLSRARIALRDPNGPWRHGSVYLYVLDRISNTIVLHAAFPDRYEMRPLVATVRDAVTGKLVLPQVIEAAKSSPEGGFVEYYFDDPTDDTDNADIPKLGYARAFSGQIQAADGSVLPFDLPFDFVIGSGFYRSSQPPVLDFAHFANGGSFRSDVVLVNLAATPIQPLVYFYGQDGELIDPDSMVDITGNLSATGFGALTLQSELPSLGEITISTNGMGDLVTGSVRAIAKDLSPIGGVLRFDAPGIGVAGVGAGQPVRDAIIPVRRQMGGINTGAALRNLSESELTLTCRLMMDGETIETQPVTLPANGQTAMFISELFEHDTSEFTGSMRCTAPPGAQEFTSVAVELDAMNRIFTTMPVIPLSRDVNSDEEMTPEE